ncbi:hypothetical protein [Caproiciproducens sp. LBM24188]
MRKSIAVAFCGIITAFCVMLLFLTGLIPIGTYALPAVAGVLLIVIVVELGTRWAWPVYFASSILAVFIAADKEAAMLYVLFFGYYPILKAVLEMKHMKLSVTYFLKFTVFNASMVLGYFLSIYILGVPADSFTVFGVYLPVVYLLLGNITYFFYDLAITSLVVSYVQRFHKTVNRFLRMK